MQACDQLRTNSFPHSICRNWKHNETALLVWTVQRLCVEPGLYSPRQQEREGTRDKNETNIEETMDGFQAKVK